MILGKTEVEIGKLNIEARNLKERMMKLYGCDDADAAYAGDYVCSYSLFVFLCIVRSYLGRCEKTKRRRWAKEWTIAFCVLYATMQERREGRKEGSDKGG